MKSTVSSSISPSNCIASGASRDSVLWLTNPAARKAWSSESTRTEYTGCTPASETDSTVAKYHPLDTRGAITRRTSPGGDAGHDLGAAPLPVVDTVEAVLLEPLLVSAPGPALGPDVLRQERDAVGVVGGERGRDAIEDPRELLLLRAPEPHVALEEPGVVPVADHQLDLTAGVLGPAAHDAELEEQVLHVTGQLRAPRGVRDLDRVLAEVRHTPVALEQRLEEGALHLGLRPPHELGDALLRALATGQLGERAGRPPGDVLDVELVQRPARRQGVGATRSACRRLRRRTHRPRHRRTCGRCC